MATLYELTEQAACLYDLLQSNEIDEQTFNDTLDAMGAGEKAESYCKVIKQLQCDIENFKNEIDRLTARKKTAENAVDRMKAMLLLFMQQTGQDKIKAGTFAISQATTQAVQITDEKAIPCIYLVEQPPKIDKAGIKKALKDGEAVNGAELINNTGVRIR
jgi:predicted ribosome quality control (RQC) complex YloA/Tae2 family protein